MKPLLLFVSMVLPLAAACQDKTNTDSTHYTDTVHYHYAYAATGTINNTNDLRSYVINNALKLSRVQKREALNLGSSWVYGSAGGTLTNNDFSSVLDFGWYKTFPHFYYWGLAGYNTSVSLRINDQEQLALGLGYNLVDKKKSTLVLSDGPLYEKGDLYNVFYGRPGGPVTQRDQYTVVRNSFRLLYHFLVHDIISFDGTAFMQNAFDNVNDYNLKCNAGISIKLAKWFSFTTTLTYNKFTRTRSENTLLNFGLTISR